MIAIRLKHLSTFRVSFYGLNLCMRAIRGSSIIPSSQSGGGNPTFGIPEDGHTITTTDRTTPGKRRRHRFHVDNIPSFQDFQQQQQIRSLYRQYLRLIWPTSQRGDFLAQVRVEFRNTPADDDWQRKRAMSEGSRRLKELSAMLGSSIVSRRARDNGSGADNDESLEFRPQQHSSVPPASSDQWPWQREEEILPRPPMLFPPKS